MTGNRKSNDPSTLLETIIMLRMNQDLRDEPDVEAIIHEENVVVEKKRLLLLLEIDPFVMKMTLISKKTLV